MSQKRYLIVELSGQFFCINALNVVEVINFPDLTTVPLSEEYVNGVLNFRGEVVSVIDLGNYLQIGKSNNKGKVVIVSNLNTKLGLLVDQIHRIADIEDFAPPESFDESIKYLMGISNTTEGVLMLLDTGKLLESIAG